MAARSTWLCAVVCAVLVAVVEAQKWVEDKNGKRVEGAFAPNDGKMAPHHFDLFFKTVLCVSRVRPPPAP